MAYTPQLAKAETNFDSLRNERVEALVETLAETVPDAKAKTLLDRLSDIKAEARYEAGAHVGRHSSRGRDRITWRHIEVCGGRHIGRNAALQPRRG